MESEWELDRIRLYQLRRDHPDWTLKRLAEAVGHCLSWVKKGLKRFREAGQPSLAMFKSLSRAPPHRPRQIVAVVRDAILGLRDSLKEVYGRGGYPNPDLLQRRNRIDAVTTLLIVGGLPQKLRFDNDTRFVGTALSKAIPRP